MKYGQLNLGQIEALVNKLGGMDVVMSILQGVAEITITTISYITHTFTVLVDETKTVEELVKEGDYDWSNGNVTSKNFPQPLNQKQEDREVVLFHFGKQMTSEQVIAEMDKVGYRPGTVHEILGLGIARPDLQREFPIIALGSTCVLDDDRHVADLYRYALRNLSLYWFDNDWYGYCRFAGVRK